MRETTVPATSMADAVVVPDPQGGDRIRMRRISLVTGPCATTIVRAAQGQFGLADGRVLEKLGPESFGERPRDRSIVGNYEEAARPPAMAGMKTVQTILVHAYGPSDGRLFLGLWSSPGRSVVGTFLEVRGNARAPVPLLSSGRRIGSIGYFPAPDTNSGALFLTQRLLGALRTTTLDLDTDRWWTAIDTPSPAPESVRTPRASRSAPPRAHTP